MLTCQQLALKLLGYVGVRQFAAQDVGSLQDSYTSTEGNDVLAAINGALQEIHAKAPRHVTHRRFGLVTAAPATVTLTAAAGSRTISAASPSGSFVPGATIAIAGDQIENELVSATELVNPFRGSTGSVSATIYTDCLALDARVQTVLPPVWMGNTRQLIPAPNYDELIKFDYQFAIIGNYGLGAYPITYRPRTIQQPIAYMVETFYSGTALTNRLRLMPLPDAAYTISFEAKLAPTVITLADITGTAPVTSVTVTGTLNPAWTGVYTQHGTAGGYALYFNEDNAVFLYYDGTAWVISPNLQDATNSFSLARSSASPAGAYGHNGTYTGTPVVTVATSGEYVDPGVNFGLPDGWDESILLPVALQRFTASPLFKNESVKAEIARQYGEAIKILSLSNPQAIHGGRIKHGPL